VPDQVVGLAHVDDGGTVQGARVVRLSPAGRIKERANESDAPVVNRDDYRVELALIRIAEVQQLGHTAKLFVFLTKPMRQSPNHAG
jgi:hypothetical protein